MLETQICIIGAGPGGATTALRLAQLGIPSVLVDKAKFPRDKVCGDGLTGRTNVVLNRIDPTIIDTLDKSSYSLDSWGLRASVDMKKNYDIPLKKDEDSMPLFTSKRIDFDNHLIEAVKKQPLITFLENTAIDTYSFHKNSKSASYWILGNKNNDFKIKTVLVIAANGANSSFTRHVANVAVDIKHTSAAVRAYYKNVKQFHTDNYIEIHFLKEYPNGYFWIFPLPNGEANVGLGMLSSDISKYKVNLKKALKDIVETVPGIKERFEHAEMKSEIVGFPLPLGSRRLKLSGDNYMMVGDAASLIDPITGEGIGTAIHSGFIAADQAENCLKMQNFSASFMKSYDDRIWRVMGPEFKMSRALQKIFNYPTLLRLGLSIASTNAQFVDIVYSMFDSSVTKKQRLNPLFWFKMIFRFLKFKN